MPCGGRAGRGARRGAGPGTYRAVDGKSPVAGLLEQAGIDVPVLDVAVDMAADRQRLRFPRDVHPNREGHAVIAARATPSLLACSGSATAPIPRDWSAAGTARQE